MAFKPCYDVIKPHEGLRNESIDQQTGFPALKVFCAQPLKALQRLGWSLENCLVLR